MPMIYDWASKVAEQIADMIDDDEGDNLFRWTNDGDDHFDYMGLEDAARTQTRIAAIIALATFAGPLVTLLREAKREHSNGERSDCPCANPTYSYNVGEPCTCGADAWNARIDEALS